MGTRKSAEYKAFTGTVDRLLSVSKEELLRREREYRKQAAKNPRKRGPKPKREQTDRQDTVEEQEK